MGVRRALATVVAGAAVAVAVTVAGPAVQSYAAVEEVLEPPVSDYELPFECGQLWTGSTRAKHSPSADAVDFNRDGDLGKFVLASAPGVVSGAVDLGNRSYGRYVVIEHADGESSLYAHLLSIWVTEGQWVDQGTIVGRVGSTGGSSGPHLHFEERVDGRVQPPWFHQQPFAMPETATSRNCPDLPLAGDWDGDGDDEVAVFRRARTASFRLTHDEGPVQVVPFARRSDLPVSGDWDGDGVTDVGVRRPGWRSFLLRRPDGSRVEVKLGRVRDVPVTGDWDGDGATDVGVWNARTGRFALRDGQGVLIRTALGGAGDQPVSGDWNGDGRSDVGVYDAATATYTLLVQPGDGSVSVTTRLLGAPYDVPVTGDWDGNGVTDLGTWAPGTATYTLRTTPARARATAPITTLRFGRAR
jgi:hypothetical protein